MRSWQARVGMLALASVLAGCASGQADLTYPGGDERAFTPCADAQNPMLVDSLCAMQTAALYPGTDRADTVSLFVRKFPALKARLGEIWLLAGGPGEPGTSYYTKVQAFRGQFPGYDIFIPDHRGTGRSSRLCAGETLDSPGGTALTGEEFGPCFGEIWQHPERTMAFSMTHAAHDLDFLISELGGTGRRYIYGISYGTGYALRFSQLWTQDVDGLILDSLVPALDDQTYDLSHRSHTNDLIGQRVIAQCAADPVCNARFQGGVVTAVEGLMAAINAGERADLAELSPTGNFKHMLGLMLDTPQARALIPDALVLAIETPDRLPEFFQNTLTPALSAFGQVSELEHADFSITLAGLIGESETNRRPEMTPADVAAEESELVFTSTLTTVQTYTNMPTYQTDAYFLAPYADLPPVLVLQGSMDPKTPLEGALGHMADMQAAGGEVDITVVDGAPHAIWFFGFDCMTDAVDRFMSGATVPARCDSDQ